MKDVESDLLHAWTQLTMESDPAEVIHFDEPIARLPDPVGFIRDKLRSEEEIDRLWAAWLASSFPGCEPDLKPLLHDCNSEIRDVAGDSLLELCPEMANTDPLLGELKDRSVEMEHLRLRTQWKIQNLGHQADRLFRERLYGEFLEISEPFVAGLDDAMIRKIAYARKKKA